MASVSTETNKRLKEVKKILVSQPEPSRSPYFAFKEKYGTDVEFHQFIHVESVTPREFRKQKVTFIDYSAVVFTSKNAIDFFFKTCDDIRFKMSAQTKYFCLSQAIANYLQKFIVYRKRKVFVGERRITDLKEAFLKHKDAERFLIPCSVNGSKAVGAFLEELDLNYSEAKLYRTVSTTLEDVDINSYDMIVFFSPKGITSLFDNYPEFAQGDIRIAVFGQTAVELSESRGLIVDIKAPSPGMPSMTMALEKYLEESNNK